jgi:hypothetical protein
VRGFEEIVADKFHRRGATSQAFTANLAKMIEPMSLLIAG